MIGKKRKEAFRLKKQYEKDFYPSKAQVIKVSQHYLVSVIIKNHPFSYTIGLPQIEGTEDERNKNFARFLVDSVLYLSKGGRK